MSINPLLLKALTATEGNSGLSPQDVLLSQLDEEDPTVAMLAKYLTDASTEDEMPADDLLTTETEILPYDPAEVEAAFEKQAEKLEGAQQQLSRVTRIVHQLRHQLSDTYAELEDLQARNDVLAEALGACHLCWGENLDCEVCGGRGRPGAFMPKPRPYERYVLPAAQRLQRQQKYQQQVRQTRSHNPDISGPAMTGRARSSATGNASEPASGATIPHRLYGELRYPTVDEDDY